MVIAVRQSKTDQSKEGRVVAIPRSESTLCAVTAIRALLKHHVGDGAELFQCMHRSGAFLGKRLSSAYVSTIVKLRLTAVNVTADGYSGHSLRAGLVTEAAREGVPAWKIRAQTGHGSDVMLARYIRDADIWTDNAAGRVLR